MMMHLALTALHVCLAAPGSSPAPQSTEPEPTAAVEMYFPTAVVVDDPSIKEERHHLTVAFLQQRTAKLLRDRSRIRTVEDPSQAEAVVSIILAFEDLDKSLYNVDVTVKTPRGTTELARSTCEGFDEDLSRCIEERLSEITEHLRADVPTERVTQVREPVGKPHDNPPRDNDRRPPLGPLGKAGIGVLSAGAVTAIVGGVLLATRGYETSTDDPVGQRSASPIPGAVTLGIGGAAALTGVALIVADRVQAKKRRKTVVIPTVTPTAIGLSTTFHF